MAYVYLSRPHVVLNDSFRFTKQVPKIMFIKHVTT